jgi:hypothetical protein
MENKSWYKRRIAHCLEFRQVGWVFYNGSVDAQLGGYDFSETPHFLGNSTREIFEANHVSFVDAHVGHRAWNEWLRTATPVSAKDHRVHNSYLVILRKRIGLVPPIRINPRKVVSP